MSAKSNQSIAPITSLNKLNEMAHSTIMRVIVVEDHDDLRVAFTKKLIREGVKAVGVSCGEELDELMSEGPAHLIVLDVNLPGESGFDVARRLRAANPNINIIMLSARTSEVDRILGYESGADFYLCKPVSPAELSAAVRAVKRRLQAKITASSDLFLNVLGMKLTSEDGVVGLNRMDVALLNALAMAPGYRLPYWRLYEVTERSANEQAKSQLELQVFRLRKKLAEIGIADDFIKSMRSEGYQLTQLIHLE